MPYTPMVNALRDVLVNVPTLADVRIYPIHLPQDPELPAIVYQVLADDPIDDITGCAGLFMGRVQYDAFDISFNDAKALIEQVRLALQGYSGVNLGVIIKGVQLETKMDMYEEEIKNFRSLIRFRVWHREANPTP